MCSIYLINVGANTKHGSQARSPIFDNHSFVYVSFPDQAGTPYPPQMRNFVRDPDNRRTHSDPDWVNLTYGDECSNPRARALKNVTPGDILLFWGLLWQNNGRNWQGFTGKRGWYLLGVLRVKKIIEGGQNINNLNLDHQDFVRVQQNAHCLNGDIPQRDRVFLGERNRSHSRLFEHAVDLEVEIQDPGLVYQAFRAADGRHLSLNGTPRWYCSLRACRKMWDLNDVEQRKRAEIVKKAIKKINKDFDLLEDAHCDPKCIYFKREQVNKV